MSNLGFCKLQNISEKDLKSIASSSKGIQGSRKGFRKGCARKTQGQYFRILYLGGPLNKVFASCGYELNIFLKMDSSRKGIEKRIQPTKFRPPKIQILY